jgi:hypothetical protein
MRANPGGAIGPKDVIGRDRLIADLWRALDSQSVVLTSERRIGKSTVIQKMQRESSERSTSPYCVLRDLEGLRTPQEFVDSVYSDIEGRLSRTERARTKFWGLRSKLGGTQIGDLHLPQIGQHWKNLLFALMDDLAESSPGLCVFFWDELPLFVHKVKQVEGEAAAMEVLDVLRSIRQRHSAIRMVFTGSVGLHQVLNALRKGGYANDPTNDMRTVEVLPLDPSDGATLAKLLIEGEKLQCDDGGLDCSVIISAVAGHFPFYIHSLVARLASEGGMVGEEAIHRCLRSLLSDPNDPAHFHYYRERIRTYYDPTEEAIALAALDALCDTMEPMGFGEVLNRVRHQITDAGPENVRDVMHLLGRDHYLNRTDGGRWCFRYEIVRHWWQIERGSNR